MRTVLCSIFLAAFAAATLSAAPPAVGDTAPDFTLRALGGNDVKLSDVVATGPTALIHQRR